MTVITDKDYKCIITLNFFFYFGALKYFIAIQVAHLGRCLSFLKGNTQWIYHLKIENELTLFFPKKLEFLCFLIKVAFKHYEHFFFFYD